MDTHLLSSLLPGGFESNDLQELVRREFFEAQNEHTFLFTHALLPDAIYNRYLCLFS